MTGFAAWFSPKIPKIPSRFFLHLQDTQVDDVRMDVMQDLRHSEDVFVLKPNRMEKCLKGLSGSPITIPILIKKDVTISKVQY